MSADIHLPIRDGKATVIRWRSFAHRVSGPQEQLFNTSHFSLVNLFHLNFCVYDVCPCMKSVWGVCTPTCESRCVHVTGWWCLPFILFERGSLAADMTSGQVAFELLEIPLSLDPHLTLEGLGLCVHVPPCLVFMDSGAFKDSGGIYTSMASALPTKPPSQSPLMHCTWKLSL